MPVPRLLSTAAWQARPLSSPTSSCAGTEAAKKAGEYIVVKRNLKVSTWWKPSLISLLLLTLTLVHKWGIKATLLHSLQELPLDIYFLYSHATCTCKYYLQATCTCKYYLQTTCTCKYYLQATCTCKHRLQQPGLWEKAEKISWAKAQEEEGLASY